MPGTERNALPRHSETLLGFGTRNNRIVLSSSRGLELCCGASTVKTLWQRLVERHRRIKAELEQLELELAQENALKPPPQLFPKRPYKASTIALFCVFGFFVAFAAWFSFRELVIPFFR